MSITQKDRTISIPGDTAYFHIDQQGDQLKLYVPHNKKQRQVCLVRQLPITLLKHLGIRHPGQGVELAPIIIAPSLFVVDVILSQDGIIEVNGVDRPEDDGEDDSEDDGEEDGEDAGDDDTVVSVETSLQGIQEAMASMTLSHVERTVGYFPTTQRGPRVASADDEPIGTPATPTYIGSPDLPEQPELYKEFLGLVIQQAESVPSLPVLGSSVVASVAAHCNIDSTLAIRSNIPGEDLYKIGAAGELFVSYFQSSGFCFVSMY